MDRRTFLTIALASPVLQQRSKAPAQKKPSPPPPSQPPQPPAWTQWGGPHRNFQTEASGHQGHLAGRRTARDLEAPARRGLLVAVVENGVLYTMYGKPRQEFVLAANAETGETLWEQATPMTFKSDAPEMGNGPYSDAAHRRRSAVHDRRRRPPAVPRQEDRQAALDAAALGATTAARG